MKKKIFGLLLGATFMFTLTAGVFSTYDAKADEPGGGHTIQIYLLDEENNIWCNKMGNNCLPEVIID